MIHFNQIFHYKPSIWVMIHMCVYLFLSTIYLDTVFIYYRQCGALHLAWQSFPFFGDEFNHSFGKCDLA